jgi:serpin B
MRLFEALQPETAGRGVPQALTDGIDENTRLFLVNSTRFRGRWADPFLNAQTLREVFHAPEGDVKVEMMHTTETLGYAEVDGMKVVAKEYDGLTGVARGTFYIVLPPSGPEGLAECERQLSAKNLTRRLDQVQEQRVELHLPKFEFENIHDLRPALEELGIRTAFADRNAEKPADFSGMNGSPGLRLEGFRQSAEIVVEETETEGGVRRAPSPPTYFGGMRIPPTVVRCDRPFLFVIRDDHTKSILYMGRVAVPNNDPEGATVTPPKP